MKKVLWIKKTLRNATIDIKNIENIINFVKYFFRNDNQFSSVQTEDKQLGVYCVTPSTEALLKYF